MLSFEPTRYIRTFDVIADMNSVLPRRKRMIEIIALYANFDCISKVKPLYKGLRRGSGKVIRT